MRYITLFLILLSLNGCSTGNVINFEAIVKKRASYDFNCPENYINTLQMSYTQYGAKGCGQQQEYVVKCSLGPCVAQPK
jgi:hypothetical protein